MDQLSVLEETFDSWGSCLYQQSSSRTQAEYVSETSNL